MLIVFQVGGPELNKYFDLMLVVKFKSRFRGSPSIGYLLKYCTKTKPCEDKSAHHYSQKSVQNFTAYY